MKLGICVIHFKCSNLIRIYNDAKTAMTCKTKKTEVDRAAFVSLPFLLFVISKALLHSAYFSTYFSTVFEYFFSVFIDYASFNQISKVRPTQVCFNFCDYLNRIILIFTRNQSVCRSGTNVTVSVFVKSWISEKEL